MHLSETFELLFLETKIYFSSEPIHSLVFILLRSSSDNLLATALLNLKIENTNDLQ